MWQHPELEKSEAQDQKLKSCRGIAKTALSQLETKTITLTSHQELPELLTFYDKLAVPLKSPQGLNTCASKVFPLLPVYASGSLLFYLFASIIQ